MSKIRVQKGIEIRRDLIPDANHLFTEHVEPLDIMLNDYLDERLPIVEKERSERTITGKR